MSRFIPSKSPSGAFRRFLQSAARIIFSSLTKKFHTCSLRRIFCQVHASTENDFNFLFRCRGKLCEAFLTLWSRI